MVGASSLINCRMSSDQSQPVVQTILESFTRCFNPSSSEFPNCVGNRRPSNGGTRSRSPASVHRSSSKRSSPTSATNRLELNDKEWDDVFKSSKSTDSRRRRSSLGSRRDHDDHADVVARAKKAAHKLDPETIEQRSLKRKLEIFRTRDSDLRSAAPEKPQEPQSRRACTPEELVCSDSSEEEITNLTSSRKRFACGIGANADKDGPIASFAKFFNLNPPQPNPFGLCFATPVRTASAEQPSKFSDDQLTTEEFIRRHADPNTITPDLEISRDGSDSRLGEEDTITSTLYFDQKYSHVVQTRPPMPLFHSQAVPCHDYQSDELTKIVRKKAMHTYKQSPPRLLTTTSKSRKSSSHSPKGKRYAMTDAPPSPMHISDKSDSVSTANSKEGPWRPDILHDTAAEI